MKQKTVFITGASRGIGAACARRFAKAGYHVFINCKQSVDILHDLRDELRENGGSCDALTRSVDRYDQRRLGSDARNKPFFRILLFPGCHPLYGFPKAGADHQHFFHVGTHRRFL